MDDRQVQCCRCKHKHRESDRDSQPVRRKSVSSISISESVCPRCSCKSYYDITPWTAWCWKSGLIELGETAPAGAPDGAGAIVIARGPKSWLEAFVQGAARHSREGPHQLIVPGVPEAIAASEDALQALIDWLKWCGKSSKRWAKRGVIIEQGAT